MARRRINVFSMSFLDAMTCGFGAVILFYMVINGSIGVRAGQITADMRAEVNRLEEEVLEGYKNLVELRNSVRENDEQRVIARGLAERLIERITRVNEELATYDETTLARREHINRLKTDLKSLEEATRRLSAGSPSEKAPGDRTRARVGDGDRQYLTGLKVGGKRIFILVDVSASMLGDDLVNIIRRRNLPDEVKRRADKWQQAVSTVDWLTTQIPRDSRFQIYTFNDRSEPLIPGSDGSWLDGSDGAVLDEAMNLLRAVVPRNGTNLHHGLTAVSAMRPPPDNLILLVDGLPTQGESRSRRSKISGSQRLKLFDRAIRDMRRGFPINIIMFPMEGDPMAASAFWKVAVATGGSYMSPPGDWP